MAEHLDDLHAMLDAADEMLGQGEVEQALILLERLKDQYPESPEVMLLLGDARADWGDLDEALEAYDRATELDPEWALAFAARARCLLELGRMAEAETDVERALCLDKRCAEAYFVKAIGLEFQGRYKHAEDAYKMAARLDPENYFVPIRVSRETFEALVRKAVESLPKPFRERLEGVPLCIEDLPNVNEDTGCHTSPLIMGVFDGCSLTERRESDPWSQLPPRIVLFQRNIERVCATQEDLVTEVELTLLHEIGHYFGLEEEDLERLDLS